MKSNQNRSSRVQKEILINSLLFLFLCSFLIKVVFGAISGSKSLLVSGMFPLFGIFISIISSIRIHAFKQKAKGRKSIFSHEKLEFFIIAGISLIIAVTTCTLLFAIGHLTFFHTLFPPGLLAAWVAVLIGAANLGIHFWLKERIGSLQETNGNEIISLITKDFILSILVILSVVIARCGFFIIDYLLAILEATYILVYSIIYLYNSFQGLMNASCDRETLSEITEYITKVDSTLHVKEIKVNKVGRMLEIIAVIYLPKLTKISEAGSIINRIKEALDRELSLQHEVHIGIAAE